MILGKTCATPRRTGSRRPLLCSLSAPASPASPPLVPPVLVVEAASSFGAELDLRMCHMSPQYLGFDVLNNYMQQPAEQ